MDRAATVELLIFFPDVDIGKERESPPGDVIAAVTASGGSCRQLSGESLTAITGDSRGAEELAERLKGAVAVEGYVTRPLGDSNRAVLIGVEGMTCNSCVKLIERSLPEQQSGVRGVRVSLKRREAFVEYDPSTSPADISTAIYDMGFDTEIKSLFPAASSSLPAVLEVVKVEDKVKTVVIAVKGMVCHSCVKNIEMNIGKKEGVEGVVVSLEEATATVTFSPSSVTVADLCTSIEDLGFDASPLEGEKPELEEVGKKDNEEREKSTCMQASPQRVEVKGRVSWKKVSHFFTTAQQGLD